MLRRFVVRLGWVVAAVAIALGAAGVAAALDHGPGSDARPELTYGADRAITPGLDAATARLRALSDDVDGLGSLGRTALSALVAQDQPALQAAITAGVDRVVAIRAAADALDRDIAALPGVGAPMPARYGPEVLRRYAALVGATAAVSGLADSWNRLTAGSIPAIELTQHLAAHDEIAGVAIREGAAGKYAQAIVDIGRASAELGAARQVRNVLAATVDTSTLDDWIARNLAYDVAVHDLWQALVTSKGRVTAAVRTAAATAELAKKQLPPDARALVIILGDVARGGLNQAVIAIEEARGRLLAAAVSAAAAATPGPSPRD